MRRPELVLVGGLAVLLVTVIVIGQRMAPPEAQRDTRMSTELAGPRGAKGLADVLRGIGIKVEQRRRALYDVARDSTSVPDGATLALLDPEEDLSDPELAAVTDFVDQGGRVLAVGATGLESCFGYDVSPADTAARFRPVRILAPRGDSLPRARRVLTEAPDSSADTTVNERTFTQDAGCDLLEPTRVDTLLRTSNGRAVALDLRFDGGGRATLVAEPALLNNRGLKETDAALVVLPWLLDDRPSAIVFDEYHQGFGEDGSLVLATWRWAIGSPLGWVMLQLAAVGLLALAVHAVRFGPALSAVERRRRSPTEHLDALAAGLERAEGRDTAVRLIARGLKRRLTRGAAAPRGAPDGDLTPWLRSLELASRSADAQLAVKRFANLTLQRGGDAQVLAAAIAVEDVWQALGPKGPRTRS